MFGDPMRDAAREERVMRALRGWPEGERLPALAVFGHHAGLDRGARDTAEVERRLRAVLDRLVAQRRVCLRVHPPGNRALAWLVRLAETGRILHSSAAPAHWFDLSGAC